MSGMFSGCKKFVGKEIEYWDVSKIQKIKGMFYDCNLFNANLSFWGDKLSLVTNMSSLFRNCSMFEGKGLETWDVSEVEYMNYMFFGCKNFIGTEIENWDIDNLEDMKYIFAYCRVFNPNLTNWDDKINSIENITGIFYQCTSLEGIGLSNWDTLSSEVYNDIYRIDNVDAPDYYHIDEDTDEDNNDY